MEKRKEAEMGGLTKNGVWDQLKLPDHKPVVGTKTIYKRKIGKNGRMEK